MQQMQPVWCPMPARRDDRSAEAKAYRRWYQSPRWRALRARQLAAAPFCVMCRKEGTTRVATVCDHVEPHRGDETRFWCGPFQSLCDEHHSRHKQAEERRGHHHAVDAEGWPTDPRHPANARP